MEFNQKNVVRLILIALVVFGIFVALNPKTVQAGDTVTVDYVVEDQRGIVVDTSLEYIAKESSIYTLGKTYTPLTFTLGAGEVIEGFEQAVAEMVVGEEKIVVIPEELAYGRVDTKLFLHDQPKEIKIDREMRLLIEEYEEVFQRAPKVGEIINLESFGWEMEVSEITGQTVILTNNLQVGDEVTLQGTNWKSTVTAIEDTKIVVKQNPEMYDVMYMVTEGGPLSFRVIQVKEDTFTIDANHPLAGHDLTFHIYLRDRQSA